MIEAMACGAPVVAFNRGAVSELIEDGVTGFVVEDETSAVGALRHLSRLSRTVIRKRFEERFTARRMARDYFAVYRDLHPRGASSKNRFDLAMMRHSFSSFGRVPGIASHTAASPRMPNPAIIRKAVELSKRSLTYPASVVLIEAPIPTAQPTAPCARLK